MKIGIDIDNTITTTTPLAREYCIRYNEEVIKRGLKLNKSGFAISNFFDWTKEECQAFREDYLEELLTKVPVKENAQEIIRKLKEKHEISIITARKKPNFREPYEFTKKYLEQNGIVYDNLIVGCEDKYQYCIENGIDIMNDDEARHIDKIKEVMPIIVFRGMQNENCEGKNVWKVDTWEEVYEKIRGVQK